ncbi:pentapeptide repeat-containing protein, partial [Candidatus Bathyarchaeota archaeon]
MADENHIAILKKGVDIWNKWRKEKPSIQPDLSGAVLREANLGRANLSGADLSGANLSGAVLR